MYNGKVNKMIIVSVVMILITNYGVFGQEANKSQPGGTKKSKAQPYPDEIYKILTEE